MFFVFSQPLLIRIPHYDHVTFYSNDIETGKIVFLRYFHDRTRTVLQKSSPPP